MTPAPQATAPAEVEGFRLAPRQRALWRAQELQPGPYRSVCRIRVTGGLDRELLRSAVEAVAARHEILRTVLRHVGGLKIPSQVILDGAEGVVEVGDPETVPADLASWERAVVEEELGLPAGVDATSLRVRWWRRPGGEHAVLLSLPALLADRPTLIELMRELAAACGSPAPQALDPDDTDGPMQYADVAEWQNEILEAEETEEGRAFWAGKIPEADLPRLPCEREPSGGEPLRVRRLELAWAPGLSEMLASLPGLRPRDLLLAAWAVLLQRRLDGSAVDLGVASAGRRLAELAGTLGPLERRLPLRVAPDPDTTFRELCVGIRREVEDLSAWEDYLDLERLRQEGAAHGPVPLPLFSWHAWPAAVEAGERRWSIEHLDSVSEPVRVELVGRRAGSEVGLALRWDPARFPEVEIEGLGRQLGVLTAAAVADPDTPVGRLPSIGVEERRQILFDLGSAAVEPRGDEPLHARVLRQGRRTPDAVAVAAGTGVHVSYGELERQALRLAAELRSLGVTAESPVAVAGGRGPGRIVALLGVLSAGAAFVPLDVANPPDRLARMLAGIVGPVLATHDALPALTAAGREPLLLESLLDKDGAAAGAEPRAAEAAPEAAAYVIFTSGSTGEPKGVVTSHRAVVNRILWGQEINPLTAEDRVFQIAAPGFDFAVWEIFGPLLAGGCVVLPSHATGSVSPATLVERMVAERITCVHFVPSLLRLVVAEPELASARALRLVFSGGEALAQQTAQELLGRSEACLCNQYGPTEATIDATWWHCRRADRRRHVPIGRPIDGSRAWVLDRDLEPCPLGSAGELHLGGLPLARGYLGRPAATATAFVPDPHGPEPGQRLYRTGDLARLHADGGLEFLGRMDRQVKLRGTRIELGEVEAALAQDPEVVEAVAVLVEDSLGGGRLVAYLAGPEGVDPKQVEARLRERLPAYMLPTGFMVVESLPRSPSGKIDHRALPRFSQADEDTGEREPPRNPIEDVLCGIFADVLGVEAVGIRDSFFGLGGHSLLAMRLVSRIRRAFHVDLSLQAIFETPVIADLAQDLSRSLESSGGRSTPPLEPVPRDRPLPLSSAQRRLWFLQQLDPASTLYNVVRGVELDGPLALGALRQGMRAVVARHESLRTRFPSPEGLPEQRIAEAPREALGQVDLEGLSPHERDREVERHLDRAAARPFDLVHGPIFEARLLRLEEERHALLLATHHIVCDAWSVGVFVRDLGSLYGAYRDGRPSPLEPLAVQYGDFAAWQQKLLAGDEEERQLDYWRRKLAGAPQSLDLPYDWPPGTAAGGDDRDRGAQESLSLGGDLAAELRALGRREGATPFMAVLAAWKAFLALFTGEPRIAVGVPVAYRSRAELEPLVGCFLNVLPFYTEVTGEESFLDLLRRVRTTSLEAHAHQEVPFERIVEALSLPRSHDRHPIFQVAFDLFAESSGSLDLPSLQVNARSASRERAKFDLTLFAATGSTGLDLHVSYRTDRFRRETVAKILQRLKKLLAAVAADPATPLASLDLATPEERAALGASTSIDELDSSFSF